MLCDRALYVLPLLMVLWIWSLGINALAANIPKTTHSSTPDTLVFDVVVYGGTVGGVTAALAAARNGYSVALIEPGHFIGIQNSHTGHLGTLAMTTLLGGIAADFTHQVHQYYKNKYGDTSKQVSKCAQGLLFEPHVGEQIFSQMLAAQPNIKLFVNTDLAYVKTNLSRAPYKLIDWIRTHPTGKKGIHAWIRSKIFIDASFSGTLAKSAGGRSINDELKNMPTDLTERYQAKLSEPSSTQPSAPQLYQSYNCLQSQSLCLTNNKTNSISIEKPTAYSPQEYNFLYSKATRTKRLHFFNAAHETGLFDKLELPNQKLLLRAAHPTLLSQTSSSNIHKNSFENRALSYSNIQHLLGWLYYFQNDVSAQEEQQAAVKQLWLPKDEVRYFGKGKLDASQAVETILGHYVLTDYDIKPTEAEKRPPVNDNAIATLEVSIQGRTDSAANIIYYSAAMIPYGSIVAQHIHNLYIPVPVSTTLVNNMHQLPHYTYMALGEAAGEGASLVLQTNTLPHQLHTGMLQNALLKQNSVIMPFKDVNYLTHPDAYAAIQFLCLKGFCHDWYFRPDDLATKQDAELACYLFGIDSELEGFDPARTTRANLCKLIFYHPERKF